MELLVVGAGAMGRWVAAELGGPVAFADVDPTAAREAAAAVGEAGVGARAVGTDTEATFETVCLAVPVDAVPGAVAAYAGNAGRAMFDVAGVMGPAVAAMREHLGDRERASFHPLFAPERAPGNVAAAVDRGGPVIDAVREALSAAGNRVFETTAAEHDRAMETVQAAAHAAVLAWALAARDVREEFHTPVSAGVADLAATVTDGSPAVYADIQAAFDGADRVAAAARRLADADGEAFRDLYREAGANVRPSQDPNLGPGPRPGRDRDSDSDSDSDPDSDPDP